MVPMAECLLRTGMIWGECHDNDGSYRSSGRIYKVSYGKTKPAADFNLATLSDSELVKMQLHKNDWFVRHARRILQERSVAGKLSSQATSELQGLLQMTRKFHTNFGLRGLCTQSGGCLKRIF